MLVSPNTLCLLRTRNSKWSAQSPILSYSQHNRGNLSQLWILPGGVPCIQNLRGFVCVCVVFKTVLLIPLKTAIGDQFPYYSLNMPEHISLAVTSHFTFLITSSRYMTLINSYPQLAAGVLSGRNATPQTS